MNETKTANEAVRRFGMGKTVLIYASVHHQNTKKVVEYVASHFSGEMDVVDITKEKVPDLFGTEWVIFASGIYRNTVHEAITSYIESTDLSGKKAIILYTCGMRYRDYAKATGKRIAESGGEYIGNCYCRGVDTTHFLEKIGGIAKGHPNETDMEKILKSLNRLMQKNA
jgi:flavodoxin